MPTFNVKSLAAEIARRERPSRISLERGLCLKLSAKGESWLLRYQLNGKRRDLGLGKYPEIGLKDAREAADDARRLVARGIDPIEQKHALQSSQRAEMEQATTASIDTRFRTIAEAYITQQSPGWSNKKHIQQWSNTLKTYAYPVIGDMPVADIGTEDILRVLNPIWTKKNETASRVRSRIELVLNSARALGHISGMNPATWRGHLDALLPAPNKVQNTKHHAAMPWKDLPSFWLKLKANDCTSSRALQFTILTACRTTEVRAAEWSEIDFDAKLWSIPKERMKANKPHVVPLTDQAIQILEAQLGQHSRWVFPAIRNRSHLSNMAMAMLLRDVAPDYTVHGFRSTFRVWGAEETNHPSAVMEMALAHVIPNTTEAAYQRSDLLKKRRSLMEDWANFVAKPAI